MASRLSILATLFFSFAILAVDAKKIKVKRVLLISPDGMHAEDLSYFIAAYPNSNFANMAASGIRYPNAKAAVPTDSFPALVGMLTGATPKTSGIYYEGSFARDLYPPGTTSPLTQYPGGAPGGIAQYSEVIEASDGTTIDGGYIVAATLPVNASGKPVYPYDYIKVNTVLNVVHDAGRRTAWIDKQLGHIWVAGPGGAGCDDCFFPSQDFFPGSKTNVTTSNTYEQSKMTALLNQIRGYDRTGSKVVGVPKFFGATFQIVSAMQKYAFGGGYNASFSTPNNLTAAAFQYVDGYMGTLMTGLKQAGLSTSTAIIVCAKYGNAPVNPATLRKIKINWSELVANITGNPNGLVFIENDDVALLWLNGTSLGPVVGQALATTYFNLIGAKQVLYGKALEKAGFNNPLKGDSRVPDVIIKTIPGVIYTGSSTKYSEHGGFNKQDRSIALLVYHPSIRKKVTTPLRVSARSVAPSILKLLGLNPNKLTSSEVPGILPGLASAFDLKTSS